MKEDFDKVAKVIESCKTRGQLQVAKRMAELYFLKHEDISGYHILLFVVRIQERDNINEK